MTFLITAIARNAIFQSSDYMLSNPMTGASYVDQSNKHVVFPQLAWEGMVTYAGVGSFDGRSTAQFIKAWLPRGIIKQPKDVTNIIKNKGYLWLDGFFWTSSLKQHEFVFAYFWHDRPYVQIISLRKDASGTRAKSFAQKTLTADRGPSVCVSGSGLADFTGKMRERLLAALQDPVDPEAIRHLMRSINRDVSKSSKGLVSAECSVFYFRPGTGTPSIDGPLPIVHSPFSELMDNVLKKFGVPLSSAKPLAFARSGPWAPLYCEAIIVDVDDSGYILVEKSSNDFFHLVDKT